MLQLTMLRCPACSREFGLTAGTGMAALDGLPDPFQAICIHCENVGSHKKADVGVRTVPAKAEG